MPNDFFDPLKEIATTHHNLPHWQQSCVWIFVTWRQADSVPREKLRAWEAERDAWLPHHPKPWDEDTQVEYDRRFLAPFEGWLDRGMGSCLLRDPANRRIVADALLHFDGERYRMGANVIMPNHVHLLLSPLGDHQLPDIIKSLKGFTARQINEREARTGTSLWQADYFDRLIRSQQHLRWVVDYIAKNPTGLSPTDYTLSLPNDPS